MILHGVLLTLQSLSTIVETLVPYLPVLYNRDILIIIVLTALDVIVQLMICFICVTIGSDERLRKIKMTLDMTSGVPKVRFCLNESFTEIKIEEKDEDGFSESTISINYALIRPRG